MPDIGDVNLRVNVDTETLAERLAEISRSIRAASMSVSYLSDALVLSVEEAERVMELYPTSFPTLRTARTEGHWISIPSYSDDEFDDGGF